MRRRRRNPDTNTYLMLGLMAAAGYVFYNFLWKPGTAVASAVGQGFSTTSSGIANVLESLFPHASATFVPGSSIVLATGQEIPLNAIDPASVGSFTDTDNTVKIQFFYAGKNWRTTSVLPDDTNTYYAV